MRIFAGFWVFVFLLFALVQYNDPDALWWIGIYLYAAVISALAFRKHYYPRLLIISALLYLAYAIYLFPPSFTTWIHAEEEAHSIHMKLPMIEEARESFGVLICVGVFAVYWIFNQYFKK